MIAYIVKNWQSEGIQSVEGERCDGLDEHDGKMFRVNGGGLYWWGSEVVETFDEARVKAMKARDKRIVSLHKQIAKLESMTFEKPGGEA